VLTVSTRASSMSTGPGREVALVFVVGQGALSGAHGLGELDLGEAALFAQRGKPLAELRSRALSPRHLDLECGEHAAGVQILGLVDIRNRDA
jgi:hypothetical protein